MTLSTTQSTIRRGVVAALLAAMPIGTLAAQLTTSPTVQVKRSGPRFGMTWLGGGITDSLRVKHSVDVQAVITQFGWQYESQILSMQGGPVAVNEFVLLVGGLDQGAFLPSLSWMVGIRTPNNFEFGVGPNVTPVGVALAMTAGVTFRAGALAIPVNVAVVPGRVGTRLSLLTGFNTHR